MRMLDNKNLDKEKAINFSGTLMPLLNISTIKTKTSAFSKFKNQIRKG